MNNKGVSAIIGVILMTAIVVAIAGTVYVYVSTMVDKEYSGTLTGIDREFLYLYLTFRDGTEFKFKEYTLFDFDKLELNHNYLITYNLYWGRLVSVKEAGVIFEYGFVLDSWDQVKDINVTFGGIPD